MTILLYDDGKLIIDKSQPLEGISFDNLIACISNASNGDVLTYNGTMWQNTAPAPVLYLAETENAGHDTILNAKYTDIVAAINANKSVFLQTVADGVTSLTPIASFGGSSVAGYSVTFGSDTYTATTETGDLVKQS